MSSKINSVLSGFFESRRFNLYAFIIITALTLLAYSNTFTASFHFDDDAAIAENPAIKQMTWNNVVGVIQGVRPVVSLSLLFNYYLGGLNVVGYHILNIGVHIINSIFVYLFILRTLSLPSIGQRYAGRSTRMALFGALLFAVHPIQTESVTYIISRSELLATCFYLATVLLFIKGGSSGKFSPARVIGMVLTALLAMASKQWAVTLPAMLMLYDFLFFSKGKVSAVMSRWYLYLLVALPWMVALRGLDLFSQGGQAGVGFNLVSTSGLTPLSYFYTSLNVIWTYIRLLVLPINQNLDYDYAIARSLFSFPTILSFLGHLAVLVGAFMLYRKRKWTLVPFGVAWFYIGLSPTQSIVPVVDMIFEHRVYMPSIGFFMVFILLYESVFDWLAQRKKTVATA